MTVAGRPSRTTDRSRTDDRSDQHPAQGTEPQPVEQPGGGPAGTTPPPVASGPPSARRPGRLNLARVLSAVGRTLIGGGVVILLFVAYQLWGTNLQENRSQNKLESDFSATLDQLSQVDPSVLQALRGTSTTAAGPTSSSTTPVTVPREVIDLVSPQPGEAMGVIRIPKIGMERRVVEGVEVDDLRKGPGHYPETPLPGQAGNVAIAGHRTTYGAPFNHIDELAPGDEIDVQTVQGTAVYKVDKEPFVVSPNQVEVLKDGGDNRLTLTSCHPKLSAAQRMVVTAQLVSAPFPALPANVTPVQSEIASTTTVAEGVENPPEPTVTSAPAGTSAPTTTAAPTTSATPTSTTAVPTSAASGPNDGDRAAAEQPSLDRGLAGDRNAWPGALGWGLLTAAVGFVAWLLTRLWDRKVGTTGRLRHVLVYLVASPVLLFLLFLCFENVDRLLPAY